MLDTTFSATIAQASKPKAEVPAPPQWVEVWAKPDWHHPIRYGVQALLTEDKKLYRAFCNYPASMGSKRVESPEYTACDAADFVQETGDYIRPHIREIAVKAASAARALMKDNERSPSDMATLADEMRQKAVNEYSQWQREEEERQKQRIVDEDALKNARYWLRGMELILEQGTPQELFALKSLFNGSLVAKKGVPRPE